MSGDSGDSVIEQYNNFARKKCEEVMMQNKAKSNRDYLSVDKVFSKEIGGFVAPKLLNKETFKNLVKNSYKYLGQTIPTESQLEDLFVRAFVDFTFEEFTEFLDVVQSGQFDSVEGAFKSFKKELDARTETASMTESSMSGRPRSIEITEDESVQLGQADEFQNVFPEVGTEAEFGFAPSGRGGVEMSATMRRQQERLRVQREARAGDRPVPQRNIFTGERGRPSSIVLDPAPSRQPPSIIRSISELMGVDEPSPPPLIRSLSLDFGGGLS
jgi:hypothetical protein